MDSTQRPPVASASIAWHGRFGRGHGGHLALQVLGRFPAAHPRGLPGRLHGRPLRPRGPRGGEKTKDKAGGFVLRLFVFWLLCVFRLFCVLGYTQFQESKRALIILRFFPVFLFGCSLRFGVSWPSIKQNLLGPPDLRG